nr:uncharacterized protein CI109_003453 [Kwoniella shandongensis]KAA5528165.1 hypothetical protein CI109_003453 [Kwoniella shandongensis]
MSHLRSSSSVRRGITSLAQGIQGSSEVITSASNQFPNSDFHPQQRLEMITNANTSDTSGIKFTTKGRSTLNDLDLGIGTWEGKAVFTSEPSTVRTPKSKSASISTSTITPRSTIASGSASSPISIGSSSPSPTALPRPRAIPHFTSPLPRTAYTPPRPQTTQGPAQKTTLPGTASASASGSGTTSQKAIHPFFTRARSVPTPSQPRLVAHYSSTESSQTSEETASTSTTWENNSRSGHTRDVDIDHLAEAVEQLAMSRPRQPLVVPPTLPVIKSQSSNIKGKGKATRPMDSLPLFHYSQYDPPPSIVYTTCPSEADDLVSCLKGNVLGFDLEWPPAGKYRVPIPGGGTMEKRIGMKWNETLKKYEWGQGRTALVQLCDEKMVILIHLGENTDLPQKVIEIIRDPSIYKLGVQVKGDGQKLLRDFPEHFDPLPSSSDTTERGDSEAISEVDNRRTRHRGPSGLLELSHMARAIDPITVGPGSTLIKLATLCRTYLEKELDKSDDVRRGNWFGVLDRSQRDYAANDVYSSLQIFLKLRSLAEQRGIPLNLDSYCSSVGVPLTLAKPKSANTTNSTGPVLEGLTIPEGIKPPSPAQLSALTSFLEGTGIVEIASTRGIKLSTAESYICNSVQILGIEVLQDEHKRRLWDEIPQDSWTWKRFKSLYASLKEEIGTSTIDEAESVVSDDKDGVSDSTTSESDEEVEEVEIR